MGFSTSSNQIPKFYYVCNACRQGFETLEIFMCHKRTDHAEELKGIKVIIFEERFIKTEDDFNCDEWIFPPSPSDPNLLNDDYFEIAHSSIKPEIKDTLYTSSDTCIIDKEIKTDNEDEEKTDTITITNVQESCFDNQTNATEKYVSPRNLELPNPYILLKRLNTKQSKVPSSANAQANIETLPSSSRRCRIVNNVKQNTDHVPSYTVSEPAHDLIQALPSETETGTGDNQSGQDDKVQELQDSKFIVASVLTSSDGSEKIQFMPASTPIPISTPGSRDETPHSTNAVQPHEQPENNIPHQLDMNNALADQPQQDANYFSDINNDLTITTDLSLVEEQIAVVSDIVSSFQDSHRDADHVFNQLVHQDTESTKNAQTSMSTSPIEADSEVNAHSQATSTCKKHKKGSSIADKPADFTPRYKTRRANRRSINYSEIHSCERCNQEFATFQDLEDHEKLCEHRDGESSRNFNNEKRLAAEKVPGRSKGHAKVEVPTGSKIYDAPYEGGNSDDDDGETSNCSKNSTQIDDNYSESKPLHGEEPTFFRDLQQLSFTEWLKKQADENPDNVIRLEPDLLRTQNSMNITAENPITCKLCWKKLKSDFEARSHVETCWRYKKKSHGYCFECEKSFRGPGKLREHNLRKHPIPMDGGAVMIRPKFKCQICSRELISKAGFRNHMEIHELPNLRKCVCEICGVGFRSMGQLQAHKISHSSIQTFKCQQCPQAFKQRATLSLHIRRVHANIKDFYCTPCDKYFINSRSLEIHARIHTGEKPYNCKVASCDQKFLDWNEQDKHHRKEHFEELGMKKLQCTKCDLSFPLKNDLIKHKLKHTTGDRTRFKCTEPGCTKSFSVKWNLQEHLIGTHKGETPYQCELCGNAYWKLWSFKKHMKGHNNPPDQVLCHLCPRKFPHNYELQQHLIFHEKGKQWGCDTCGFKCMTKAGLKGHMKTHDKVGGDVDSDSGSSSEIDEKSKS